MIMIMIIIIIIIIITMIITIIIIIIIIIIQACDWLILKRKEIGRGVQGPPKVPGWGPGAPFFNSHFAAYGLFIYWRDHLVLFLNF